MLLPHIGTVQSTIMQNQIGLYRHYAGVLIDLFLRRNSSSRRREYPSLYATNSKHFFSSSSHAPNNNHVRSIFTKERKLTDVWCLSELCPSVTTCRDEITRGISLLFFGVVIFTITIFVSP